MQSLIFAHSLPGAPKERWQTMRSHALAVAQMASEKAGKFGAGELGRVAGLLHDVGKYSREFQRKLTGEPLRIDHSTAGARIAAEKYHQLGRLLAYVIAGHHAGLANGTGNGNQRPLEARLDPAKHPNVPACTGWEADFSLPAELALPKLAPHPDQAVRDGRKGYCLSLLTRMLLSALVDADRLDTGRFYAEAEGGPNATRGGWEPLARLKERLDLHMAALAVQAAGRAENDGQRSVNAERAKVLAAARAKAALPPGLFSLTVPTGGGKTLASLTFAMDHAVRHGLDRVIYVIPFTSIIEQTARVFRDVFGPELADHVLEHHSAFREDEALAALERHARERGLEAESGLQAGERLRLATEDWNAPLIITTAVQFFESLFSNRPSKCRKLHNIARSVVILDEAQTLPLKLLRPCVAVLDELARNYRTTAVLCTATQPALAAKRPDGTAGLAGGLLDVREIVDEPDALYQRLRRVKVAPDVAKLTDDELVDQLCHYDKVLCIVGTRAHARELFKKVKARAPVGTFHLSALMCPAHRSAKLAEIKAALAQEQGPCRVIATTVIEAGVDVDFPRVYRIMAGLDSIAQAAGRCNREGKRDAEQPIVQLFEIEGRRSIPALHTNEDSAREILRQDGIDALGLAAMEAYFRRLYWGQTQGRNDGLDAKDILGRLNLQARDVWLPFADIARDFRLIDEVMEPVIVPWDASAQDLIAQLEDPKLERPGAIARKLQPYIVNVPRGPFAELRQIGRIVPVNEFRFEDQFMQLADEAKKKLYKDDLGFDWNDPTFRKVENGIF